MKDFIKMGYYYLKDGHLIRTICEAYETDTNRPMIAYAEVAENGEASQVWLMDKDKFKKKYLD